MILARSSDLEKVPRFSLRFGGVLGLVSLYSSCPFTLQLFFLCLRGDKPADGLLILFLSIAVSSIRVGAPFVTLSHSLFIPYVISLPPVVQKLSS